MGKDFELFNIPKMRKIKDSSISKIVDKILPIATKAITIVNGNKPHFNPSLLNEIT